jgi:putative peptidoglycan lipid II flippase
MSRVIGQTSGMAVGTLLSRLTGVIRDVVLVAAIGTAIFSDAYSVANSIPNIIYILVAGGAINSVFIPTLVRRMQEDDDNGKVFADRLLTLVGSILLILVLASMLLAPLIIRLYTTSEWNAANLHVATIFAYWCLPQIFFYGIYTLVSQVLNARDIFILPMFAPIANNIIVITTGVAFMSVNHFTPNAENVTGSQLTLLGAGTTLGVVVQALLLLPALGKAGYHYRPRFDFRGAGLSKTGDMALWTIGFVAVNQLSFLIISNLTTYANAVAQSNGATAVGFTSYQKGQLMMMLPHAIITVSLITALLPRLSRHAHDGDANAFGRQLTDTVRLVAAFIIPSAALVVITGPTLGILLYGHGATNTQQASAVGLVASMFALGLPAFSIFYALLRSYYARENTKTPFVINLVFNALHIGIGSALFFTMNTAYKVASLALAYGIAYTTVCLITWRSLAREVPALKNPSHVQLIARISFASMLSAVVVTMLHKFIFSHYLAPSSSGSLLRITFDILVFLTTYIGLASRLKINEVTNALVLIRLRLGK